MNIAEASAVQALLEYLLMDENDPLVADHDGARHYAVYLADRAQATLMTGIGGAYVRSAWPDLAWPAPNAVDGSPR